MSSSPTFIVSQTKEVEEELLAIDQGRSHTSSPRSMPNSRLEILMMDLVRSQTELARSQEEMARSQKERARSIDQKIESLARALTEQTRSPFSGVTPIGQFRSMNRLPFGLNRLPCPQND